MAAIKARKVRLRLAWGQWLDENAWKKQPVWNVVTGYEIDSVWAAHRLDQYSPWTLTHRHSGFAAARVATFTKARQCARALNKQTKGAAAWRFTDPFTVRGNPTFAGLYELAADLGVSERTIRRDIHALEEAGCPVRYRRGENYIEASHWWIQGRSL